jgi:hypothetical protein
MDIFKIDIDETSRLTQAAAQSAQLTLLTHDCDYNTDAVTISDSVSTTATFITARLYNKRFPIS